MATALYRRYRPESFAEVIGQDHVTTPLQRALRAGRIGHAYLFSGPRGCGKTTSARILARCLNCEQGPTDSPCGQCDSCRDLARDGAGSLDVVEIDAASHGGVDDARELRERASFAPVRDRYKVFIIDEAHMVTSAGFNALLKLVEEPPEHVKFVFATTEPDKVIGTIRSRTHHYPFRLIPPQILTPYLEEVSAAESVDVGAGVLPLVVRAGGGSARDSMSVLDQLMAGAGEDGVDFQTAIALLGFTDTALLDRAVGAIAQRDAATLYEAVEQVLATGHEPRRFVEDLLERMRDLIVLAAVPERGADLLPQVPADELEAMRAQATLFAPADLSRCGDLIHETLSTMSGATSPRLHLELLAARLVLRDELAAGGAVPADGPGAGLPAQAGRAAAASAGTRGAAGAGGQAGPGGQAAGGGPSAREEARRIAQEKVGAARQARGEVHPSQAPQAPQAGQAPQATQPPQAEPTPQTGDGWGAAAVPGQGAAPPAAGASQRPAEPGDGRPEGAGPAPDPQRGAGESAIAAAPSGGPDADAVRGHWSAILDELSQIRRPSWALISQNAHVHEMRGSTLVLGFRTEGLVSAFHRGTAAENLGDAVRRIMRLEVTVEAVVGEDPGSGGSRQAGPGSGGPGAGGPVGPAAGSSGPGGTSQGAPGGPTGSGPRGGDGWGPRGGSPQAPRGEAPARTPAAWGDAAPAAVGASAPARDRAGAFPPEPDDDPYPPEPEDAYPPDPRDEVGPGPEAVRAPQRGARWSDALAPSAAAPATAPVRPGGPTDPASRASAAGSAPPPGSAASQSATSAVPAPASAPPAPASAAPIGRSGDVPVVEDEGRDSLPEDQSRTYGQAALKRALAEGRVVRSRPTTRAAPAAGGAAAPGTAAPDSAPAADRPWSDALDSDAGPGPGADDPMAPADASPAAPAAAPAAPAGAPSAAPAPTPTTASPSTPAAARSAPEPTAPAAARSGIALAREAAMASRTAGRRGGRPSGPDQPAPDEDPTGGASRDDEDAVVATRNGREVIEKMLGGKVLEVIDETQNR